LTSTARRVVDWALPFDMVFSLRLATVFVRLSICGALLLLYIALGGIENQKSSFLFVNAILLVGILY
jgi:hypothetical protein